MLLDSLQENVRNASLMAEVCREEVPKLCSRSLISKETRPCSTQGMSINKYINLYMYLWRFVQRYAWNGKLISIQFIHCIYRKLPINTCRSHYRVHTKSDGNNASLRTGIGVQNPIRICRHLAWWGTSRTVSGAQSNARTSRPHTVSIEILWSSVQVIPKTDITPFY